MKLDEFKDLLEKEILPECKKIMDSKGLSYSGLEDKLGNFKRCGTLAGIPTEKAWFTYFVKHFDALSSFIRGEYSDCEPIKGRIIDLINYLFLLCGILKEQGRLEETKPKEVEE
jgi:hypothetical protein